MSANIQDCCRPGVAWEGSPNGSEGEIAGIPCYFSPKWQSSQGPVVLLVPDVFGAKPKNIRLYADRLEQAGSGGMRAAVLDVMGDSAVTPESFAQNPIPERTQQVEAAIAGVDAARVGVLGFCWGAKPCVLAGGKGGGKLAAAAGNHPSLLELKDVEALKVPTWFNFSGPDDRMVPPELRKQYEPIVAATGGGSEHFEAMQHGWTLKGDEKDTRIQQDAAKALQNLVAFFNEHLA